MLEILEFALVEIGFACAGCFAFRFMKKRFYQNKHIYDYTPIHDIKNVEEKHKKIWDTIEKIVLFPLLLVILDIILEISGKHFMELKFVTIGMPCFFMLPVAAAARNYWFHRKNDRYTVSRYMVYPDSIVCTFFLGFYALFAIVVFMVIIAPQAMSETGLFKGLSFDMMVVEWLLIFFVNFVVVSGFSKTPRELALYDVQKETLRDFDMKYYLYNVSQENYDKAAKRYYGIWRNRLILANLVAGAQLILGGFVTLTNAGDSLMGIRILGLAILAVVFIYILIQSREFEDPVVVKGMVYPSEKKRVTLKWVILSAIALYTLGAIILL